MLVNISCQNKNDEKKKIEKSNLRGLTYFWEQPNEQVSVMASCDHQQICRKVLGEEERPGTSDSYIRWDNVSPRKLVQVLFEIAKTEQSSDVTSRGSVANTAS
ncbi:hypothetical protein GCM10017624_33070 [Azotobacter vinelandii]|nr:hypothetical protein GCM10017624_33070 [Azotobacter vinelandii]